VPGANFSIATAANDSGQVTGSYNTYGYLASPMPATSGPVIRSYYGVTGASGFGALLTTAPGSWIEIYGENLANSTRAWQFSDFAGNAAPTSLDGVSVSIGGQAAYVSYISPEQINALAPSSIAAGPATVTVTNGALTSPPESISVNALQPEMLTAVNNTTIGTTGLAAFFPDGAYVSGCGPSARNAKSGDTIVLHGIGFGPVLPGIPAGQVVIQDDSLLAQFQVLLGPPISSPAQVTYAGLAPGSTGLYQFNFVLPKIPAGSNDLPVSWTLNGIAGSACTLEIGQ
jgi:uncharacterized protein (TIGR03437 family)